MTKPFNYWKNSENVRREINKIGYFPRLNSIRDARTLYDILHNYHGGPNKMKANYNNLKLNYKKAKRELNKIMPASLYIPTFDELREAKDYSTIYKIEQFYSNLKKLKDSIRKYKKSKKERN